MSPSRLVISAAIAVIVVAGCDTPTSPANGTDASTWPVSLSVVSGVPEVCGAPVGLGLMLGPDIRAGSVEVVNDESSLYLTFRSERPLPILATAIWVGDSPDEIPTTWRGVPRLRQFPYKSGHAWGTYEVVWEIPRGDLPQDEVVIAAFAQVGLVPAWAEGEPITPDRDWATYFRYQPSDCAGGPVGPEGGSASSEDERATITVPAGALAEAADITVTPVSVDDLPGDLPVAAIGGAVWDFGPDGLEFAVPATVVLAYDPTALPAGVMEEDLSAYSYNGTLERLPSVVDPDANLITAEISHFSYVWPAYVPGASLDLEVTELSMSPAEPGAGDAVDFQATVRNNGPGPAAGAIVVYEADGDVTLGDVPDACSEVADPSPAAVAVACPLETPADATTLMPIFQITPQQPGGTVAVRARAVVRAVDEDTNPDNNEQGVVFSAGVVGPDLMLSSLTLAPGSESIVGGLMGFSTVVNNLGPAASSGGTVRFAATGDVALGDVGACTEVANPSPATVAVDCDVPPIAVFDLAGVGYLRLVAQSAGDVTVSATVTPAPGEEDPDISNNTLTTTITISAVTEIDLQPFQLTTSSGSHDVGQPLTFQASVFPSGLQNSNGGTIVYEAFGDVTFGAIAPGCAARPIPGTISVECSFGPIYGPTGPIGALEVIPQSRGVVTFAATTYPIEGDVDTNPDNDRQEIQVVAGAPMQADLVLHSSITPTSGWVVGSQVVLVGEVENLGPEASHGGYVTFRLGGALTVDEMTPPCAIVPDSDLTTVTVRCDLVPLGVGETDTNPRLRFTPALDGAVSILIYVDSALGDADPDGLSNRSVYNISVSPAS